LHVQSCLLLLFVVVSDGYCRCVAGMLVDVVPATGIVQIQTNREKWLQTLRCDARRLRVVRMWLGARQAPVKTGGVLNGSSASFGSMCCGASRRRHAFKDRANAARLVTRVWTMYIASEN
jgi:hypothetical protein